MRNMAVPHFHSSHSLAPKLALEPHPLSLANIDYLFVNCSSCAKAEEIASDARREK
jgi:hypothetical protein